MSDHDRPTQPEPTTQIPAAGGSSPHGPPPAAPPLADDSADRPWYRRPGPLAAAVIGAIVALGLGGFLLATALADDDEPSTVSILRFDRTDVDGNPIQRGLTAEVTGEPGSEDAFLWLAPPNVAAPEPARQTTNGAGRAVFRWAPVDDLESSEGWKSTIELVEQFTAEESLEAADFRCMLQRRGLDEGNITLTVSFDQPADVTAPRMATYRFPNFSFLGGDVVTCPVGSGPAVAPPSASSSVPADTTTTVPDTTTTVPDTTTTTTTVPATTTTTTVPATTTTTTVPATTTTVADTTTTVAVQDSVMAVIDARADLSRLAELIDVAGLRATLSDPAATLTLFAPNNAAFAAFESSGSAPDLADPAVVESILLTHVHNAAKLSSVDVLALAEIVVVQPGPHAIDNTVTPPTMSGIGIIEGDVDGVNGFIHVLDGVLTPAAG